MKIIPIIRVKKWNLSQEIKLFTKFLNHPDFPTHRHFILQAFPGLREKLLTQKNKEKTKKIIMVFLGEFHKKHKCEITYISHKSRIKIAKEAPQALRALGKAMEYSWRRKTIYAATPTLLPFSPFGTNQFYFSILGTITKKGDFDVTRTAIHEISHFVFFDILRGIERHEQFMLPPDTLHLLKESLTAALFNEEPLKQILKTKNYPGNPEIRKLYIKLPRRRPILLTNYIRKVYVISKRRKTLFSETLYTLVISAYHSRTAFAKKRMLWNRYGRQIFSKSPLRKRYQAPILFGK